MTPKILIPLLLLFLLLLNSISATTPDEQFFQKIHQVEYFTNGSPPQNPIQFWSNNKGDCDDKSIAYADYLYFNNKTPTIVTRIGTNGVHSFIRYNNSIYDPTLGYYQMNPILYDALWLIASPRGWIDAETSYRRNYNYYELCRVISE